MPRLVHAPMLVGLLGVLTPFPGEAQEESRWFWEIRTGWSSALAPGNAYDVGPSAGLGIGIAVNPEVRLRFTLGADALPYSDERFGELFEIDDLNKPDAGDLMAEAVGLTSGIEWSPGMTTRVRPWVGTGLTLRRRSVNGFITSPAWARCSTGTLFRWDEDPVTGRSTLSAYNPVPEPGCADLRRDIDVEGWSLGLMTSAGLTMRSGAKAVAAALHLSTGMLPGPLLTADLTWRYHF